MGKKFISVLVPPALAMFLILASGCGAYNASGSGSGSGSGSASSPGAAQGFYECTLQQGGTDMEALILPTDVFYGVVGTLAQSSFSPTALITGQGAPGTSTYTGTFTEYLASLSSATATISATDVPQSSIGGTITENGVKIGFGGAAWPSTAYSFSTPAAISNLAGVWSGTLMDGANSQVALSISNSGSITTTSTGCQVTGTATANTTDNFFTVNLKFGQSPCQPQLANQSATAVAVVFVLPDQATTQLLMPATVGSTVGTVFSAQR